MNHQIKIEFATHADVPLLLEFIQELADYHQLGHEVEATDAILRKTLFGYQSSAKVIIAYLNEKPVGFALFFYNYSTFLGKPGIYIEDFYIKSNIRGQGIGKKMFSYLAKLAKEQQCGRLEGKVLNSNKSAIQFYESHGAKPMTEWIAYRVTEQEINHLADDFK